MINDNFFSSHLSLVPLLEKINEKGIAVRTDYRKEANLPILPKRNSASGEVRLKLWNPVQRKQEEVTYIFRLSLDLSFILTGNQNKLIKIQCHKVNKPLQGMAP